MIRALLDNIALLLVTKAMQYGAELYVLKLSMKLKQEEARLSAKVCKQLGLEEGQVLVRLKGYPDGSVITSLELKTDLEPNKLAQAQRLVDSLGPIRQNVLIHKSSKH